MVNYPKGVFPKTGKEKGAKIHKKNLALANLGMDFEKDLNESNDFYLLHNIAVIYKRPTPINVVRVDYSRGALITQAYFEKQSTTDYNGIYKGRYVDFEAKSVKSKTSFPLHNIPIQQIEHLERIIFHGGIAFFLIDCYTLKKTYLLKADFICKFYREKPRKSIPMDLIQEEGYEVPEGLSPRYDYLKVVDEVFFK